MKRLTTLTFLIPFACAMLLALVSGCDNWNAPTASDGTNVSGNNSATGNDGVAGSAATGSGTNNDGEYNPNDPMSTPHTGECGSPILEILSASQEGIRLALTAPHGGMLQGYTFKITPASEIGRLTEHYCHIIDWCRFNMIGSREASTDELFQGEQFILSGGECVEIILRDSTITAGGITRPSCVTLECGKSYAIIVTPRGECSNYPSEMLLASTDDCYGAAGCSYTQGYWKNHVSAWPATFRVHPDAPTSYTSASSFYPGSPYWTGKTWQSIFSLAPGHATGGNIGKKSVATAHQFVAAILNRAHGANAGATVTFTSPAATMTIQDIIDALDLHFLGTTVLSQADVILYGSVLDTFNNGRSSFNGGSIANGPAHCD